MRISKRTINSSELGYLKPFFGAYFFSITLGLVFSLHASAKPKGPLHWSGDETVFLRNQNQVELIGHAAVHQENESLFADRILIELDTKVAHAFENVVFTSESSMIQAAEMHMNLETRTGTILRGRVSTPNMSLSGEQIHKLGEGKFQAYDGEFTTCRDCPKSWVLSAESVELEVEAYAYLKNLTIRIGEAPAMWLPYFVVPIKTKRQSGFLMPSFGFTNEGFTFVQPFFWATSKSTDMTLGAGNFGGRGNRVQWEGRYRLDEGQAQGRFYYLKDRTFEPYLASRSQFLTQGSPSQNRYAIQVSQMQRWFGFLDQRLRIEDVSDTVYPSKVGDVGMPGDAYLTSELSLSHSNDSWTTFLLASRYRNLLLSSLDNNSGFDPRERDPGTVQVFPQWSLTTTDRFLGSLPVAGGLNFGFSNFARTGGPYDSLVSVDGLATNTPNQFRPGIDPLREATRFTLEPSIYTTLRPFDAISVTPQVKYKNYLYDFRGPTEGLYRSYVLAQTEVATQLERVYNPGAKPHETKYKHVVRPAVSYSLIPHKYEPNHPFVNQINFANENAFSGFNFDNQDIVPLDARNAANNYFVPLGHSMTYGLTSRLVQRRPQRLIRSQNQVTLSPVSQEGPQTPVLPSYSNTLDFQAGQSFNFRELKKTEREDRRPMSRVFGLLNANLGRTTSYVDYYYTPYLNTGASTSRHVYSTGVQYSLRKQKPGSVNIFDRTVGMTYSFNRQNATSQTQTYGGQIRYSINDSILPSFMISYDLIQKRLQSTTTTLSYQSPSECWRLDLGYVRTICESIRPEDRGYCGFFSFNLSVNLTGSGYGNVFGNGGQSSMLSPGAATTPQ